MQIERFESKEVLYTRALEIIKQVKAQGATTFGLATGGTMEPLYEKLRQSDIDFSDAISFNLDEYVGLDVQHDQSYNYYMHKQLFDCKPFKMSYLPNGLAENAEAEANRYEQLLQQHELDFQLLGIGVNGHIAFNEPGTSFASETHLVDLQPSTLEANARFFDSIEDVPKQAYTMGIQSILRAKVILLIATGEKKRAVLEQVIAGEYTENNPATALVKHNNVIILTDLQEGEN
ncbi:glucosamine-6-phosphate deaminase [Kurthia senegalensis]|uniref:glucosamine-6-phosphate deaminase n=1 Tax=Kurthia senegalensis TaxID=1033740 RepID=UPI0004750EA9|nr:glucosamine-6-phosphate deaminase [Kurthia senegalensis]